MRLDFSEGVRQTYWQRLLETLQQSGAKIIVTDLLPVVEGRYTEDASLERLNSDVEDYNAQIKQICRQYNITFFERYYSWIEKNYTSLYTDAVHPNAQGHQLIAQQMFDFLKTENLL